MAALSLDSQPAFRRTVSTAWATDRSEPGMGFSLKKVSTMSAFSRLRNFSATDLVRPVSRNPDVYLKKKRRSERSFIIYFIINFTTALVKTANWKVTRVCGVRGCHSVR